MGSPFKYAQFSVYLIVRFFDVGLECLSRSVSVTYTNSNRKISRQMCPQNTSKSLDSINRMPNRLVRLLGALQMERTRGQLNRNCALKSQFTINKPTPREVPISPAVANQSGKTSRRCFLGCSIPQQ
jgi:hypothetical protein